MTEIQFEPVLAHAGEEVLFVLIPIFVILAIREVAKKRKAADKGDGERGGE